MRSCATCRRGRRRLAFAVFGLACGLGLAHAGCVTSGQARREITGSASEGLVYVVPDRDDVRRTDIWRARLSDGAVRPFMQTPERDETWPFWSVSASALVVEVRPVDPPAGGSQQQLMLWRDGVERDLPGVPAQNEAWAAWAATGSSLAYVFTELRQPPSANGIAVVDVETGEQRILVEGTRKRPYIRPELDPDGVRAVAERRDPRSRRGSVVWLLRPGACPQALSHEDSYALKARFTRDGRHVLLTRKAALRRLGDLILMRSDGTGTRVLASTPKSDDHSARASPVRDEMVFVSNRNGKYDLFLADLEGGEPRSLTGSIDFEVGAPRWSPDGERIAVSAIPREPGPGPSGYLRMRRDKAAVLVVDREGRLLFKTRGFSPDWMPPWR